MNLPGAKDRRMLAATAAAAEAGEKVMFVASSKASARAARRFLAGIASADALSRITVTMAGGPLRGERIRRGDIDGDR